MARKGVRRRRPGTYRLRLLHTIRTMRATGASRPRAGPGRKPVRLVGRFLPMMWAAVKLPDRSERGDRHHCPVNRRKEHQLPEASALAALQRQPTEPQESTVAECHIDNVDEQQERRERGRGELSGGKQDRE